MIIAWPCTWVLHTPIVGWRAGEDTRPFGCDLNSKFFPYYLPRHVLSACCKDDTHVSNRLSGELAAEFSGAEKSLAVAAAAGERTGTARLINILSFFGSCESLPQDLTTVDGASIWAGDGIHLTSNASRVATRKLLADLAHGGLEGEPDAKRT